MNMAAAGAVELLKQLIGIPSVNPEHTQDARIAGEERLSCFLAGYLEEQGFEVTWQDRETGRPNLVASYGPEQAPCTLLLEAHMDTVGVDGVPGHPFQARIEGGRLYGRGACDCKGPMAAGLAALTADALEALVGKGYRVLFAAVMGEETGNTGAMRLVQQGLRADRAIVLEPTDLSIVHAHKGALWFEVHVAGRAAHGANPEQGVNAILGMARLLDRILLRHQEDRRRLHHETLGPPTLSVGQIHGGVAVNVVPDHCMMRIDRRTLPGEDGSEILEGVEAELDALLREGLLLGGELKVLKEGPPFHTDENSELVQALGRACERAGRPARRAGSGWYSDAGPLSTVCPEVVAFGPGSIRQAHTSDEFIELESLHAGTVILSELCRELKPADAGREGA
ncbi:MAG: M20 family metallopeptidase [Verrucomicrobia bacterium]|nr:M20 family metallopeptidase [Verrucomicrobiota bacterium]